MLYDKPIEIKDRRQYRPIVLFVFHPVIKYSFNTIVNYAFIISLILSFGTIFFLIKISKLFVKDKKFSILILILTLNFMPFIMNLALSTVEI